MLNIAWGISGIYCLMSAKCVLYVSALSHWCRPPPTLFRNVESFDCLDAEQHRILNNQGAMDSALMCLPIDLFHNILDEIIIVLGIKKTLRLRLINSKS